MLARRRSLRRCGDDLSHRDVEADRFDWSNLGYYTLEPAGSGGGGCTQWLQADGLPFGVTLFAERNTDEALLILADRLQRASVGTLGATPWPLPAQTFQQLLPGFMPIAVCGAHMQGLPLNTQLTSRGAYLLQHTRTAARYRFYVLPGGPPQRPGLVRVDSGGTQIEVEVWAMPHSQWGTFIADIPSPLCLGQVQLEAGELVTGFLCEAHAVAAARIFPLAAGAVICQCTWRAQPKGRRCWCIVRRF
jgi:allophanate hydrolase